MSAPYTTYEHGIRLYDTRLNALDIENARLKHRESYEILDILNDLETESHNTDYLLDLLRESYERAEVVKNCLNEIDSEKLNDEYKAWLNEAICKL